jgi:hypothetical protein
MPDTYIHHKPTGTIRADIREMSFPDLAQKIADTIGNKVEWDPVLNKHQTSTAFDYQPVRDALPMLLKGLNFAYVPDGDGQKLKIFPPPDYQPPAPPAEIWQVKTPPPGGWFDY